MNIPTHAKAVGRCLSAFVFRFANRRFFFTFTALAVWSAKIIHIHDHRTAVHPTYLQEWAYSFVAQDIAVLTLIRLLLDHWLAGPFILRVVVALFNGLFMFYNAAFSLIFVSFYLAAGSEIHLRNVSLPTDPSSRALILSGSLSFVMAFCLNLVASWLFQNICYGIYGYFADVVNWPFAATWRLFSRYVLRRSSYLQIPQIDIEDQVKRRSGEYDDAIDHDAQIRRAIPRFACKAVADMIIYMLFTAIVLLLLYAAFERPIDRSLIFLSWTPALMPFVDLSASSPVLQNLPQMRYVGIQRSWDNRTALGMPPTLDWLPKEQKLAGFEDWYNGKDHYNADADPSKISNLDQDLLAELKDKLQDIPVRHVLLFFLESTRNDVFPLKKESVIWNRMVESFGEKGFPPDAMRRLATLTPTANFITGDYDDGFDHLKADQVKRGGARFTKAHTTATYTLKSLEGTLCGISPLLADFNLDYKHHIYQPCLPHIFNAMNQAGASEGDDSHAYNGSTWQSYFFQASTMEFDKQYEMMTDGIGFPKEHVVNREYLRSDNATHGAVTLPKINAFAFEEDPLEDYIRDAFVSAKEKNERVFLSHITSTSHHAFKLPEKEKYVPVAKGHDMLSHYVNTEGYDDKWIRKVLDLLDEQGVANETLIVFVGDHGLSMPENDIVSPYYNPNVGVDHVPLVVSHPLLPAFDVHDAVHSSQILPTILDILLETGSLNNGSQQVASDLVRNYEGQSLIRTQVNQNETTGQGNWQFTIVNPGRAMITARDARYPDRHLVIPLVDNVEWRFTNLTYDPMDQFAIQGFDFGTFLDSITHYLDERFGMSMNEIDAVEGWVQEGASMARWWAEENSKRWRYGPYAEFKLKQKLPLTPPN
ncbi:hypothetical protein NW752_002528 [Fusarium irregulare]|uniref:Sulfatase N-terminal domain-containing protein n=1 Tax=Fusarium irregulare TaxID=2494466 RepID=A0A9W8PDH6_9HYPO|nr:hypothetical protein NW766_012775 [Fusarium irregulare]KAJ4025067.1 hypothetical protein NW752_002528 [Fusarium irregulare]